VISRCILGVVSDGMSTLTVVDHPPRAIGHYTASEVSRLAGVSSRRVGSWARYGIMPSISERPKIYSYADVGEAILAHYLIGLNWKPRDVRALVERLRDRFGPWPLANAPLEHDGKLVVIKEGDDFYIDAIDHVEHAVIGQTLLDLQVVREALARGGWTALTTPRAHVEVDPNRHSGQPVVRGRRIPTADVAEIARENNGRAILREDYGLSEAEIDDALAYEDDVASVLAA
jgi:uncharacterized protein (DUF433 family)/DNA-binding transcriptional MerR regulator